MKVNDISIHCNKFSKNGHPRAQVNTLKEFRDVVIQISTGEHSGQINFFLEEQDLINFKNSVIAAVENYKRGK